MEDLKKSICEKSGTALIACINDVGQMYCNWLCHLNALTSCFV
jgi:hypothetical protein